MDTRFFRYSYGRCLVIDEPTVVAMNTRCFRYTVVVIDITTVDVVDTLSLL